MSAPTPTIAPGALRRARSAVSGVFFLNAVLYANVVPRFPEIKDGLGLDNAWFGGAVAAFPLGALLAGLFAATLIRRAGSAAVASLGLVVLAVALVGVPLAGSWLVLATVMLVAGAADAIVDVAQNAHGLQVQRLYRRSIINAFHGVWSVGAVVGGLLGSAAAGLSLALTAHLALSAALCTVVALLCRRFLLPDHHDQWAHSPAPPDPGADPAGDHAVSHPGGLGGGGRWWRQLPAGTVGLLAALGVLAAAGAVVEDAGSSWSAVYLRNEVGSAAATAGLGYVALQVAMTAGRLTGDRVVDRYGQRRVAVGGGGLVAGGMGFALAVPSVATTVVGFGLAGLGVATLIPAVMHTADELPGLPRGAGLTLISWLLRVGFLASPPLVGLVADDASLRVGLLITVAAGVVIVALGRVLVSEPAPAR